MQMIRSIATKFAIISFLTFALLVGGMSWSPYVVNAAIGVADSQQIFADTQGDAARLAAINEISRYMSQMSTDEIAATVRLFRVMNLLKAKYVDSIAGDKLLTGAIKGTVTALGDPYSAYLDPRMYKELMLETKGSFGGVGIMLGMKDKLLTVIAPIEGTPADKAGIKSGDHISKIDGQDTKDMALDEAVNMIRGKEGTQVVLTIIRGGQEAKNYELTRSTIQIHSVSGKMLENSIGYIRLSMFNEATGDDFAKKLQELEAIGMKALILDLRNNPGGLLGESVKVASHFVPKGPVVSVVSRDGSRQTFTSQLTETKYPLVVLVNEGSASASEIVAGAVQDTGAGILLGTKTFGKGSVQSVLQLDDASAVKLTFAKYYTPKERMIHGVGIEPDVKVEMPDSKEPGSDLQLEKAIELLNKKQ